MVRQARSEATRQKIIDSAVDLINEIGYPAAGLADIIERADMTKGALYYHFDSKEALASAIMDDGGARLLTAFQSSGRTGSPALENLIHGVFMVTDTIGRTIFGAMLGAELLSDSLSSGTDMGKRIAGTWEVLLLAIVQADSLNYYLEFLSRQASRAVD